MNGASEPVEVLLAGDSPRLSLDDANLFLNQVDPMEGWPARASHRDFGWAELASDASLTKRFLRNDVLKVCGESFEPRVYAECEVKVRGSRTVILSNQLVLYAHRDR